MTMPPPTLEKTIQNNQLKGFPFMNIKDIRRHLPPSPPTPTRRMKKPKVGIRSTRKENELMDKEKQEHYNSIHVIVPK